MMVDPMLSIVLDLRSFLTAVTTIAVVPTAVISSNSYVIVYYFTSLLVY